MRAVVQWIAVLLAVLALQGTLIPLVGINGIQPDIVFIALFVFALRYGVMAATWVGFAVGLCQDLYSPAVIGQNALCKSVSGFFFGLFNERVMSTDPLTKMLILLIAFGIHDVLFSLTDMLKYGAPLSAELLELIIRTLPRAIYSIAVAALYFGWEHMRRPSLST